MDRRRVLLGLTALGAAPLVLAQRPKLPRVAVFTSPPLPNSLVDAFKRGMQEMGYVEGRNVEYLFYSAEGRAERFPRIAAEAVKSAPDVILSGGGAPSARAAMRATTSIPIVVPASSDPVGEGLVQSLARPGGNVTGFSILAPEVSGKRVQLVRELVPGAKRTVILQDPVLRGGIDQMSATEEAARALGMQTMVLSPAKPEEYETNYTIAKSASADALIALPSSNFSANRQRLIALSAKHGLPSIWEQRLFAESGGLVSYGADIVDLYRASARYVDKLLKGAKPTDLPVERASKFELVLNLRTAKAQGVVVPQAVLIRADKVIE